MHAQYINSTCMLIPYNIHQVSRAECQNDAIQVKGSSRQQLGVRMLIPDNTGNEH